MKYEWYPSESAPELYPIRIHSGYFELEDNSIVALPDSKTINNGWGNIGSTLLVGESTKALPTKLFTRWFSFIENRFFEGEFVLPKAKLDSIFETGFKIDDKDSLVTYNRLIVGMAPQGVVVVWATGATVKTEVGMFQAKETDMKWDDFIPNSSLSRSEYVLGYLNDLLSKEQQMAANKNILTTNRFRNDYRETVKFSLNIFPKINYSKVELYYWNAESQYFFNLGNEKSVELKSLVPKSLVAYWNDSKSVKFGAEINFNEIEIFKAFKLLLDKDPGLLIEIDIVISENNEISISIRNDKNIATLSKFDFRVFEM